jgi:hypothetical protein
MQSANTPRDGRAIPFRAGNFEQRIDTMEGESMKLVRNRIVSGIRVDSGLIRGWSLNRE